MTTLPKYSNCILDHRYFKGSFRDFSGNNNHGTPTGCNFEKRPDKHVKFRGSDLITVADSSELQLTEGTFIVYGDLNDYASNDRMINKEDGGGRNYDFSLSSTANIRIIDTGGTARDCSVGSFVDAKSLACNFVSGSIPKGYKNGVFKNDFNGTVSIVVDDAPLKIGNRYTGGNPTSNSLKGVLIYNTALTDAEIAQVHDWIMEQRSPRKPKREFRQPSLITGKESGLVAAYDMKNVHGKIIDKTGNGNDGTIYNCSQTKKGLSFNKNNPSHIDIGVSPLSTHTDFSFEMVYKPEASTVVMSNGYSNGVAIMVLQTAATTIQFQVEKTSDSTYRRAIVTIPANKRLHLVGTYDADGQDLYLYVNGVATQYSITTASTDAFSGTDLVFGARNNDYAIPFTGEISYCKLFNSTLTQSKVSELYKKYAQLPTFTDDLSDANESIATEGGATGAFLSNTKWRFGDTSARYKISRDETKSPGEKIIECTTAGLLYQESQQAYGTWEFSFYKATASDMFFGYTLNDISGEDGANQTGYWFNISADERLIAVKSTGGGHGDSPFTGASYVAINTWYDVRVTRRYNGVWTWYIKGGAFTTWTLVDFSTGAGTNPFTENAYTTFKYIVIDADAGDKITNFKFTEGVVVP